MNYLFNEQKRKIFMTDLFETNTKTVPLTGVTLHAGDTQYSGTIDISWANHWAIALAGFEVKSNGNLNKNLKVLSVKMDASDNTAYVDICNDGDSDITDIIIYLKITYVWCGVSS